jgi:hypothetical protein
MKNRTPPSDVWLTPKGFYDELNARFSFNYFDPCPADYFASGNFDGLECRWPQRTYCNPPYSLALKTEFVKKAVSEAKQDKLVVMLLPVSTSTKLFHEWILPHGKVEFIKGRLPFEGVNSKSQWVNPGEGIAYLPNAIPSLDFSKLEHIRSSGQHDSMLVIFGQ